MTYIITRVLCNLVKFFFVILGFIKLSNIEIDKKRYVSLGSVYMCGYFLLLVFSGDNRSYMFQCIYILLILGICFNQYEKRKKYSLSIVLLCLYEIINIITNILLALVIWSVFPKYGGSILIPLILKILLTGICLKYITYIKNYLFNYEQKICVFYLLITCIKTLFLGTDVKEALITKMVFLTIICCTVIFFIISKIEKHNADKEKALIEENNKILSTKLHKSREILPAMVQVLNDVTENNGKEMEQQEVHELLREVNNLYGQQLKENNQEDLQLKSFCSTGLKILDQQLNIYQREAIERNINFDIFVQAPINDILKRDDIDQLRLQRALGDLVRNAFRSMEREDKKCQVKGHILLIIGCRYENILEIAVVDNGKEFPLYVIEMFGKRGVTTDGTGNGLADLVEFAKEIKASISLSEFEGRTNSFTKKISIIFDKQGINIFDSARKALITDPFWSTI